MAKYRKKPAYREATQWHCWLDKVPGVQKEVVSGDAATLEGAEVRFYVVTTHGQKAYLNDGDYVVKEPDGNGYYPCKAEFFEREHELAE